MWELEDKGGIQVISWEGMFVMKERVTRIEEIVVELNVELMGCADG